MKIHLVSDLHNEFSPYPYKQPTGTDVVIAAGDIATDNKGPLFLRESFGDFVPIVYVAGNHEYYGTSVKENREAIAEEAKRLQVKFLDNTWADIEGVLFFGGTLWTDYKLWGDDARDMCKSAARSYMNDFRKISYQKEPWKRYTPDEAEKEHHSTLWCIEQNLEICQREGKKAVVVTHMAPHPLSVESKYSNKFEIDGRLSASYASNLEELILKYEPALWVHGHMHNSFDYKVGKTRIVCNPRGYSQYKNPFDQENKGFNKELLIEV